MFNPSTQFMFILLGQLPILIVYLGGLVLALVMWRRYPKPALLTMLACGLLLFSTIGYSIWQQWFFVNRPAGMSTAQMGQTIAAISLAASVIRAAAFVLLICAVFVARNPNSASAFPIYDPLPTPPPMSRG